MLWGMAADYRTARQKSMLRLRIQRFGGRLGCQSEVDTDIDGVKSWVAGTDRYQAATGSPHGQ
jgi:hypothetical protein